MLKRYDCFRLRHVKELYKFERDISLKNFLLPDSPDLLVDGCAGSVARERPGE
jgi:hypothetical protein